MSDTTRNYEGLFLFGTAATANVDEASGTIRSFIEKHGGNPQVLKSMGDRKLAYEVAKQQRGLYIYSFFAAPPAAVSQIEREVRLSDTVLRCLITDGSHLSLEEAQKMELQKPEPPEPPEPRGEGSDDRRRRVEEDEDAGEDLDA